MYHFISLISILALGLSGCSLFVNENDEPAPAASPNQVTLTLIDGPASVEDCPNGGVVLAHGVDENGDGELDEDEVDETYVLCHGENGKDGRRRMAKMVKMAMTEKRALPEKTAPTVPLFAIRMRELPE